MATVERRQQRRSDGSLGAVRYRVHWRDPAGKQRSRTFARRRDADQWALHVEHQKLTGAYVDPKAGRITLREYAEQWRASKVWARNTGDRFESTVRLHLYPALGDRPLATIRRSDVQSWVKGMSRTLAPATVAVAATGLSSIMKAAVSDRLIAASPCVDVELPRDPATEVVPPTPEQVELLARHIAPEWRAAIAVGAGLGVRVGELLGLSADRVDFLRRTVRVDRQAQPVKGAGVELVTLKTDASVRTIPLPDATAAALSAHIARYGLGERDAIFHTRGTLVRRQRLSYAIGAAVEKAVAETERREKVAAAAARRETRDVPRPLPDGMRFHDLRHFYASLLIEGGASVKTVQRRLGHASAVETLDTYGHLWPDNEEQTRAVIDAVLSPLVAALLPAVAR
jgi:integrase